MRICGNAAGEHDGLSAGTPHSLTHSTDKRGGNRAGQCGGNILTHHRITALRGGIEIVDNRSFQPAERQIERVARYRRRREMNSIGITERGELINLRASGAHR